MCICSTYYVLPSTIYFIIVMGNGAVASRLLGSRRERKILLMFVKQIFEDFENLENKKESNLNKTCCCRPAVNSYNESGQIYLYNSIARA